MYKFVFSDFLDIHYPRLIQRVTSVMALADCLLEKRMIHHELYSQIISTSTTQGKMRQLINALQYGGSEVKSYFYQVLQQHEPYLIKELRGESVKITMKITIDIIWNTIWKIFSVLFQNPPNWPLLVYSNHLSGGTNPLQSTVIQ